MKNNLVYIITHKAYKFPKLDCYRVLNVGSNNNCSNNNYLKDNTGDNISYKNNSYCELTGLYWIWKNDNSNHVGLVHYRRYFVDLKMNFHINGRHVFVSKKNKYKILSIDELENKLNGYDVLVKKSRFSVYSNEKLIKRNLGDELWNNMSEIIYNNEKKYIEVFDEVSNNHTHLNCNMFYGDKMVINEYCKWLFEVLNKIDEKHKEYTNEYYHNRELGYLSEILFEVWLKTNKIKYNIVSVVNIDNYLEVDGCMNLYEFIKYILIKLSFITRKGFNHEQHK